MEDPDDVPEKIEITAVNPVIQINPASATPIVLSNIVSSSNDIGGIGSRTSLYEKRLEESSLDIANRWLELYQTQPPEVVTRAIKEQIRLFAPICYSPMPKCDCLKITYNDDLAFKKLFGPMELFLSCFQKTENFFQRLETLEPAPTLCGRVFKLGEPTYSCRDCGMDPTCVLCVKCFRASVHRRHRYKIATSSGGGYCDCGDSEAWRTNFYCEDHVPASLGPNPDAAVDKELEDIQDRAKILFSFALEFCQEMLTMELHTVLPRELTLQEFEIDLLNIPCPLETYATVLYNDETHTFDLVIKTLSSSVDCSKRMAIDFATIIDREGRSLVRCDDFKVCDLTKQTIERLTSRNGGRPLKVTVMQSYVLAHQTFAMKLLNWIQKLVNSSSYYRKVFCDAIMKPRDKSDNRPGYSILEGVMCGELHLWKQVRSQWHHLAISALLKDYETKKSFSWMFAKLYPDLMRDFIEDDHDHSCSITSLSVQIFTVPTIAHHLIEHEDIFLKIINTFMSEYESRRNADGVLEFDRNTPNFGLKRASYCILDLKYILTSPPVVWTEGIRKGFLHGFNSFVTLLSWMENMDSVVRQTAQHLEYEQEWESAFNLHIKLTPAITLLLDWCGSDRNVLIPAYRRIMAELGRLYGSDKTRTSNVREYADHSATCIDYDVSRQPVSVHKPVSRFLAGLYLELEKHGLDFFSSELNIEGKPSPEVLIEPALRTQVLVGQIHANMWKRNGFALLHQMYFYHNVKCRSDMLDKDIISLQMGAAIIESNEFLLHLLDRYGLYQYITTPSEKTDGFNEDDAGRHTRLLAEEFLQLIIILFSSRFTPGVGQVTKEDCVKKEVIQLLCIEPMTHSSLNKALVENVNLETGLEAVINEVADNRKFKQSTQSGLSLYELKNELYSEYDCFHYHYSREEQSKAEQRQQARKKAKAEPEIFPPPKLPLFTGPFNMVVNILKCDVMMSLLSFILEREVKCLEFRRNFVKNLELWQMSYSDSQIQKVLHLICLGLNEEIVRNEVEPGHFFRFCERAKSAGLFQRLEEYVKHAVNSSHIEMVRYIINLKEIASPPQNKETVVEIEIATNKAEEEEKQKKAKLAAESRMKMLAKISAAQKSFMAVNADLFAENDVPGNEAADDLSFGQDGTAFETCQALGPGRTPPNFQHEDVHVCILCQEEQSLSDWTKPFVLAAYVQRSSVLCQDQSKLLKECEKKSEANFLEERDPLFLGPDLLSAPHISCCGHVMHVSCWHKHYDSIKQKERRRPFRHPMSFDVDKKEYLCPMCDCISNVVIPMTNPLYKLYPSISRENQIPGPFELWIEGLQVFVKERSTSDNLLVSDQSNKQFSDAILIHGKQYESCNFETVLSKIESRRNDFEYETFNFPENISPPKFTDNFQELVTNFVQTAFSIGLDIRMDLHDYRAPLMLWQGVSYTIIALEEFSRDQNVPFFGVDIPSRRELCLTQCVRVCALGTIYYDTARPVVLKSHAIKLISTLVTSPAELPCLLECDAFTLLVSLTHALPALRPEGARFEPCTGTMRDYYICRLMLLFHITQVLVTKDFSEFIQTMDTSTDENITDMTSSEATGAIEMSSSSSKNLPELELSTFSKEYLFTYVWRAAGKSLPKNANVDYDGIWESIRTSAVPFLRCCAKFYEKLTCVSPPASLMNPTNTYDDLVKYLGIPSSFEKLFDTSLCVQFPYRWASHPGVRRMLMPSTTQTSVYSNIALVNYPRHPVFLTPLPYEYIELINSVSLFTCNKADIHESRTPTMCLTCGAILCSQSYCCQYELGGNVVGACTHHAYYCGAGKGIFLRIRECRLFYIGGRGKGCYVVPPYVDEYGETDQGLRRGNPMTLCSEKYQQLRKSWILHLIPEEIARIVENSSSVSSTEWQYL